MADEGEKRRARDARYNASEKGRARQRRYNQSEKGRARNKRYYELNWIELNYDRTRRRRRARIAESSAALYGADREEVREGLGHGSTLGTPTARRKRREDLNRLIESRRTVEEAQTETRQARQERRASRPLRRRSALNETKISDT